MLWITLISFETIISKNNSLFLNSTLFIINHVTDQTPCLENPLNLPTKMNRRHALWLVNQVETFDSLNIIEDTRFGLSIKLKFWISFESQHSMSECGFSVTCSLFLSSYGDNYNNSRFVNWYLDIFCPTFWIGWFSLWICFCFLNSCAFFKSFGWHFCKPACLT